MDQAHESPLETTAEQYSVDENTIKGLVDKLVIYGPEISERFSRYQQEPSKDTFGKLFYRICFAEYKRLRISKFEQDEESLREAWSYAIMDDTVTHSTSSNGTWANRGYSYDAVARGSLNVFVTKELLQGLDKLIAEGSVYFSYKFGNPDSADSPNKRRDSISLYFDEEPDQSALRKISEIVSPHVRNEDDLIGRKVSDGFFMSDVGVISTKHAEQFLSDIDDIHPGLGEAVYLLCSHGSGWGLSEGVYVAIKNVFAEIGLNVSYDQESGFKTTLQNP